MKKISSWAQWFDRCAQHYQDPRMKMAYYKDAATGVPVPMETLHAIHEDVWKKLRADSQCSLLDVGSGIGLFVQAFQNRLHRVVGTDISFNMMRDATAINPQAVFLQCDVSSLPFSSKSFDRVLCYSVFHYLKNDSHAQRTIDEFRRVVKKNGVILIGDVLYPTRHSERSPTGEVKNLNGEEILRSTKGLPQDDSKPSHAWWPSSLNHQLKKKTYLPAFFKNYCKKNGLKCEILNQDIKGKDKNERYDVAIRF
ncbi:MAG TPA: class I SAM-dependent methyltransferase [Candidatus Omnitrophota bacterium]|nr:class I SAM-dependent methyltransferase [Candidatus Omnitrophota bacterium]